MSITVKVIDKTPELMRETEAAVGRFVVKASAYVEGELKSSMAEGKSGRRYGQHVASAPGESPAVDSGNLTGSITTIIAMNRLEAKIGTPVAYALFLEHGTRKMAARPLWEKVAKESQPELQRMLDAEIHGIKH